MFNQNNIESIMAIMMVFFLIFIEPVYKAFVKILKPVIIEVYVIGVGIKTRYQKWNHRVPYGEYILLEQRLIE